MAVRSIPSVIRTCIASRRMAEKNKKTLGDEQCDCKQDEREKQDRAEDEHPAGHLRIGAEDEWDGTEEHDATPSPNFRGALRCELCDPGRIRCRRSQRAGACAEIGRW